MSSTMRMWTELVFHMLYLVILWTLISKMFRRIKTVSPKDITVASSMIIAFVLLALGDTGHLGFRALAYYHGGLESKLNIFGGEFSLLGAGALTGAVTITFFYVIILDAWRKRYNAKYGVFEYILIVAAIVRLILFISPENQWSSTVPPFGWSVARNLPLMLQGLGIAYLILRDSIKNKDRVFRLIGMMILLSYACYVPVIFLVQKAPWIGMLMIPKIIVSLAMAGIVYQGIFESTREPY